MTESAGTATNPTAEELVDGAPRCLHLPTSMDINEIHCDLQGTSPLSQPSELNEPTAAAVARTPAKKKVPGKLICPKERNKDGEDVMKVVLMHARSKTWNQSFAFGKFRDWTKRMYDSAFNDDGLINGYDKPAYSTIKNAIASGKKTLDNIVKHKHSDGNADNKSISITEQHNTAGKTISKKSCLERSVRGV